MDVSSVLVEYEHTKHHRYASSGLLFSGKYVLVTSNVIMPYLIENNLSKFLENIKLGELNYENLPKKEFTLINYKSKERDELRQIGFVVASFICKNILYSAQKYLKEWSFDAENNSVGRQVLPLFFILQIGEDGFSKDHLQIALETLLNTLVNFMLISGQEVLIRSTPFGSRMFLNSYSRGVISNVVGENACFLLTDCPAAPGSEGSPVFIYSEPTEEKLVGIVISCLNWWKGEWVGLTLVANMEPLLRQMVLRTSKNHLQGQLVPVKENPSRKHVLEAAEKSLAQIVSGSTWGTAILLDKDKGIFITNAHVIESENVVLRCTNVRLKAKVLYKTPNNEVYDVAVLRCDRLALEKLEMKKIEVFERKGELGEEVYAAGYPLFDSELKPPICLTKGHISQVEKSMIKTTCNVLPGASGGAILKPNGQLLAIVVSNAKVGKVVYPRINMAIPIFEIYYIVEKFLQTEDLKILDLLHNQDPGICNPWDKLQGKL